MIPTLLPPVRMFHFGIVNLAIHLPQRRLIWFIQPRYEKDTSFYIIKSFSHSLHKPPKCVQSLKKKKKDKTLSIPVTHVSNIIRNIPWSILLVNSAKKMKIDLLVTTFLLRKAGKPL